jgi:hypothetical protein
MPEDRVEYHNITDLFTIDEINRATDLFFECKKAREDFTARCTRDIVEPVISRINKYTGYDNNPEYLAYCLEIYIKSVGAEEGATRH